MENSAFFNRKAFVAGGTRGIGLKLALYLHQKGAQVTVCGRTRPESLPPQIQFIQGDFSAGNLDLLKDEDFCRALDSTEILAVCAGPFVYKKLDQTSLEDWLEVSKVDYALPGALISLCLPFMKKNGWGRIVLFGGTRTEAVRGYRMNAAYAGAKTGLSVLAKSVAMEYSAQGITCNVVLPGFASNAPEEKYLVSEEELAQKALFLLENSSLNGVLLNVDKGWNP